MGEKALSVLLLMKYVIMVSKNNVDGAKLSFDAFDNKKERNLFCFYPLLTLLMSLSS